MVTKYFKATVSNKSVLLLTILGVCTLFSCNTKIDMADALEDKENTAFITARNSEILYTEKGLVKLKVIAPLTKNYQGREEPFTEFPEGITVYTYSDSMRIESELTAKYANYYERKGLWSASNNVIAKNDKGETLNTEHLYWDQLKKIIYTDDMVQITTSDGIQYGQGMTSDERFKNWEIKKPNSYYYLNNSKALFDSTSKK